MSVIRLDASPRDILESAARLQVEADRLRALAAELADADPATVPVEPPWLVWARREIGVREIPGPRSDPRVEFYHSFTAAGETHDGIAWCSSFCNAGVHHGGHRGTRRKNARSWLDWGTSLPGPRIGAIVVFARGSNPRAGHVGFVAGWHEETLHVLGGNQGNRVSIEGYSMLDALGYRWPG